MFSRGKPGFQFVLMNVSTVLKVLPFSEAGFVDVLKYVACFKEDRFSIQAEYVDISVMTILSSTVFRRLAGRTAKLSFAIRQ